MCKENKKLFQSGHCQWPKTSNQITYSVIEDADDNLVTEDGKMQERSTEY